MSKKTFVVAVIRMLINFNSILQFEKSFEKACELLFYIAWGLYRVYK